MPTAPEDRPRPDQIEGAPHPAHTPALFGQNTAEMQFLDAFNTGRLHSGWLISGPRGTGKATLAWRIARFLLIAPLAQDADMFGQPTTPQSLDIATDHPDLPLIASGAHPRLFVLRRGWNDKTDKLNSVITVDDVRALKSFFSMSAADGGRRVVIIDAADEMNINAANAILKLLEEPPKNTYLLLVCHQVSRLLPTIRSRCRALRCGLLQTGDMTSALKQAGFHNEGDAALAALSSGSVGEAIRLINHDGMALYAELIGLFAAGTRFDRPRAIKLAESCAGKASTARFDIALDLIDRFLARAARSGLQGPPQIQAAPGEAQLFGKIAPDHHAAKAWANLSQEVSARTRHGKAVNLDPAALILDTLFKIEQTAARLAQNQAPAHA